MDYTIKNYYTLSLIEQQSFLSFLYKAFLETSQPAHDNMYHETLLHILDNTDRFKNGCFNILFDNEKVIACSGCYVSNFSSDILICGSRTWVDVDYRNTYIPREILLPTEKQYAINNHIKCIALTFNEYNKNMINLWFRNRLGEKRPSRENRHFGFGNLQTLEFPVNINYTKQWILFELLDNHFNYDWNLIKWLS